MTPILLAILAALIIVTLYAVRRATRHTVHHDRDLGVVSTRWIAELRRDEPWSRS